MPDDKQGWQYSTLELSLSSNKYGTLQKIYIITLRWYGTVNFTRYPRFNPKKSGTVRFALIIS